MSKESRKICGLHVHKIRESSKRFVLFNLVSALVNGLANGQGKDEQNGLVHCPVNVSLADLHRIMSRKVWDPGTIQGNPASECLAVCLTCCIALLDFMTSPVSDE